MKFLGKMFLRKFDLFCNNTPFQWDYLSKQYIDQHIHIEHRVPVLSQTFNFLGNNFVDFAQTFLSCRRNSLFEKVISKFGGFISLVLRARVV